jgi:hypothetical protein
MKYFKLIILFSAIMFIFLFSCKKEKTLCGCGIENPISNIGWLDSIVTYYKNDTSHRWDEVDLYMYDYKNSNAFVFDTKKNGVYDVPITVLNCEGKVIFICGGFQPPNLDSCNIFSQFAKNKILIWHIQYK